LKYRGKYKKRLGIDSLELANNKANKNNAKENPEKEGGDGYVSYRYGAYGNHFGAYRRGFETKLLCRTPIHFFLYT